MNRLKSLGHMAIGFVVGVMFGIVVGTLLVAFSGELRKPAERQLIEDWRKIQLGFSVSEFETILGEPNARIPLGDRFPEFAEKSVPKDFYQTHGLEIYVISGIAPQVLLIFIDDQDRVVFVSSVRT